MPSEEAQSMLIEAVCDDGDDRAAIAEIDAALALGAEFAEDGFEPLFFATWRKTPRVLEHLFARGATLQAERDAGNLVTSLHEAAHNGRVDMLEVLMAHGGQEFIDAFDKCLYGPPLAFAAHAGHVETARFLLDHGASIDLLDETRIDDTPLAVAIMYGNLDVARFLLSRGANPEVPGWMQYTPRMRAKDAGPEFERLFDGK